MLAGVFMASPRRGSKDATSFISWEQSFYPSITASSHGVKMSRGQNLQADSRKKDVLISLGNCRVGTWFPRRLRQDWDMWVAAGPSLCFGTRCPELAGWESWLHCLSVAASFLFV